MYVSNESNQWPHVGTRVTGMPCVQCEYKGGHDLEGCCLPLPLPDFVGGLRETNFKAVAGVPGKGS